MARNDMFGWLLRKKGTERDVQSAQATGEPSPNSTTITPITPATNLLAEAAVPTCEPHDVLEPLPGALGPAPVTEALEIDNPKPRSEPATASCARAARPPLTRFFAAGLSRPKPLLVLQNARDEVDLQAGVPVVEYSGKQARPGKLVGVRADGRRLLVTLGAAGRTRAYTLRRDGCYRLEGASDARAPVLELASNLRSTGDLSPSAVGGR